MDSLPMLRQIALTLLIAAISGCGGGSGSDPFAGGGVGGSSSGTETAEGGIGGSGSGTATGYGSIYINEMRHFEVDPDALVTLDGVALSADSVNPTDMGLPEGVTVDYLLAEDANDTLTSGTATRLRAWHRVIGPVTGVAPLEVLGQPVQSTADTSVETALGNTLGDLENLVNGDIVAVAGPADNGGLIRASRVAERDTLPLQWQLVGAVQNYDSGAGTFEIGNQSIALGGVLPDNCDSFGNGSQVHVLAAKDSTFLAGDTLDTVTSVTCVDNAFDLIGAEAPEQVPATFEGIIVDVSALPEIRVGGQRVNVANVLDLVFGRVGDLSVGTHIEVEGVLDTTTGILSAKRIIFLSPLVELTGPLESALAGEWFNMLGVTVKNTAGTLDPGMVLQNGDTSSPVNVRGFVTGFRDRAGSDWDSVVYAEEIEQVASSDESIYGPVTSTTTDVISILGVDFDLDTASGISILTLDDSVSGTIAETAENITSICLLDLLLCPSNEEITAMAANQATAEATGNFESPLNRIAGELALYAD